MTEIFDNRNFDCRAWMVNVKVNNCLLLYVGKYIRKQLYQVHYINMSAIHKAGTIVDEDIQLIWWNICPECTQPPISSDYGNKGTRARHHSQ